MKIKKIKPSNRGITFSDDQLEKAGFPIGSSYNYTINKKDRTVVIHNSADGNTISRKKSGDHYKPLVDIRSKKAVNLLKDSDELQIEIKENEILVHGIQLIEKTNTSQKNKSKSKLINSKKIFETKRLVSTSISKTLLKAVNQANEQLNLFEKIEAFQRGEVTIDTVTTSEDISRETKEPISIQNIKDAMTVVSFFAGAGFLDKAFIDQGFDIKYASDINKDVKDTYVNNNGEHFETKDILDLIELPDNEFPKAFISIGGVDCHPFTNSNRIKRLSEHENYTLIDSFVTAVMKAESKIFMIENVPELLSDPIYKRAKEKFINLGFDVTEGIINDSEQGGYQKRNRAIVIGSKLGKIDLPTPSTDNFNTVGDAFLDFNDNLPNHVWTNSRNDTIERMKCIDQGENWQAIDEDKKTESMKRLDSNGKPKTHSISYYRLKLDEPAPTIINYRKSLILHPTENRTISHREALRLFGMPDDYVMHGSKSAIEQMIANGVPYTIGKAVASKIKSFILNLNLSNADLAVAG